MLRVNEVRRVRARTRGKGPKLRAGPPNIIMGFLIKRANFNRSTKFNLKPEKSVSLSSLQPLIDSRRERDDEELTRHEYSSSTIFIPSNFFFNALKNKHSQMLGYFTSLDLINNSR